jgi:hypothetical protein
VELLESHPGKQLTIFDLPEITKQAFLHSLTTSDITYGFMAIGISQFRMMILPQLSSQTGQV